eukprot:4740521-Prymnesium_polylepis.1
MVQGGASQLNPSGGRLVHVEIEGWFKVVHPGRGRLVHVEVEGWFKVVHPGGDRPVHAERRHDRSRRGMEASGAVSRCDGERGEIG